MARASSRVWAVPLMGTSSPMESIRSLKICRSSPFSMASALAPIISTPSRSSAPERCSFIAVLRAVWPPRVGSSTSLPCAPRRCISACSRTMIFSTASGVTGSMYVRSANSGSVMMVAGLEFTSTTRYPSSRSALQACVPE